MNNKESEWSLELVHLLTLLGNQCKFHEIRRKRHFNYFKKSFYSVLTRQVVKRILLYESLKLIFPSYDPISISNEVLLEVERTPYIKCSRNKVLKVNHEHIETLRDVCKIKYDPRFQSMTWRDFSKKAILQIYRSLSFNKMMHTSASA